MYLIGKNYTGLVHSPATIDQETKDTMKAFIRSFCPVDGKKSFEQIVSKIQANSNFTNDQIIEVILEVKQEADYTLPE
jgi:hypothetical protein